MHLKKNCLVRSSNIKSYTLNPHTQLGWQKAEALVT